MNINYKETQYNFLENPSVSSRDPRSPRLLAAQLTLSIENLVIFTIASIMVILFCFSLGVERGKKIALSDVKSPENTLGQAVSTAPAKGTATDDDDVISSGEAKKNVFEAFLVSWNTKAKSSASEAPSTPAVEKLASEPKAPKAAMVPRATDKPAKTALSATDAASAAASGSYTVQVATYKSQKSAQREADSLKQKGYRDVYVLPKGSFVIVCVGSFSTKSDASTFTRQLKSRYQDTVVRRL